MNGERRFVGDNVTAVTLVADRADRRGSERVSIHVGMGGPGERQVQSFGADLRPGDEIAIRVLSDEEEYANASPGPESCSFCGSNIASIQSLVSGPQVAICDSCLVTFDAVVMHGAALPVGASIQERGEATCGFCQKAPPEVAGLLVRNAAAVCPECLRACVDMTSTTRTRDEHSGTKTGAGTLSE